tara:strand:- start:3154 stop:3756 length:603 start_codon:yes stop_codon:yes gene_type:complete
MKRLNIILLFLLPFFSCISQEKRDSVYFKSTYYEGWYSEIKEQPLYIKYEVIYCLENGESRGGLGFYKNDSIYTSDKHDYYKNVWDKGHMVPAASQNCTRKSIKETFSYLNCALQYYKLNQGVWKQLEEYERSLSTDFNVTVIIEVDFNNLTLQKLKTGATIPIGFYKTIIINDTIYMKFYFPNHTPQHKDFKKYLIDAK